MTNEIPKATAKAAADREKAISKIRARMAKALSETAAGPRARVERMIGVALEDGPGPWTVAACDGAAALIVRGAGTLNGDARRVLLTPIKGPSMAVPGAMAAALKRVMTCAPKGAAHIPHVRIMHTDRERLELRTDSTVDECSAREWLPADVGDLAGRHISLDGRLLREGLTVAGPNGRIGRCPLTADVIKARRQAPGGELYELGTIAFLAPDDLWAYVLMASFPGAI